jgi:hypothetical protein
MVETPSEDQRNRRTRRRFDEGPLKLLISAGLGTLIAGTLGIGGDFLKGRRSAQELRCSIAQQVVLDESPSPSLNPAQRGRINDLAVQRLEQCMGERT